LRFRPWALDFTPDDAGNPPWPHQEVVNPYYTDDFLQWTTADWDPALRFWTLAYDKQLTEWLKSVDQSRTYVMAGREFGAQPDLWQYDRPQLLAMGWLEPLDLAWQPDPALQGTVNWAAAKSNAWNMIAAEIQELQQLMQDDRDRYLAEIDLQADNGPDYIMAFIQAHIERYPWTIELINCGLAIGNIAYSYYKAKFKRVRPSFLCPGLAPAFGPPGHPSFPSGHSFLAHLMALLLLEIPGIRQRYGMFALLTPNAPPSGLPGQSVAPYPIVTISQANPAVVTLSSIGLAAHGLGAGEQVVFQTTGTLPPPITPGTPYYVLPNALTPSTFQISTTVQGPPIATTAAGSGTHTINRNPLLGRGMVNSPLLWLSQRIAKNRERLGVHYQSDSMGSRHFAAALWRALLHDTSANGIYCPTLISVINHATAEWPTKWP
jgi:hypothetical protein